MSYEVFIIASWMDSIVSFVVLAAEGTTELIWHVLNLFSFHRIGP